MPESDQMIVKLCGVDRPNRRGKIQYAQQKHVCARIVLSQLFLEVKWLVYESEQCLKKRPTKSHITGPGQIIVKYSRESKLKQIGPR